MLSIRHVSKSYGSRAVLDDVSLVVPPRARIGLAGPNGIGKSTLLRILAGIEPPDAGAVTANGLVGYLPQEPEARPGETLLELLARRTGVAEAGRELARLEAALPDALVEHAEALERFLALGGADLRPRAAAACAELGLDPARLDQTVATMSGGEAARAGLAAILVARFDVFLLDEPTNNLDFAGLDRLERFVTETKAAVVVVSHDRAFLDRTVTRVAALEEGMPGILAFTSTWSEFAELRAQQRQSQYRRHGSAETELERIHEQDRRMARWEERGYGQGRKKKKSKDIAKAYEKKAAQVAVVEKPWEPWQLRLTLRPRVRAGDVVLRLEGAEVERGDFRLGPLDLELGWQDRLAVLGPNGAGKTTLLRAMLGELPLAAGRRRLGPGVIVGALEQRPTLFAGSDPLADAFRRESGLPESDARTLLAKFDLGADDVLRPAASLSPGERSRAVLALLTARGVNCLFLDEPTNHLDLEAIEELERALANFEGTLVVVSHDRRFLEAVSPSKTLEFT